MRNDMLEFTGEFVHSTEAAILIDFDDGIKHWFPYSLIEITKPGYEEGDKITIELPEWLAKAHELI